MDNVLTTLQEFGAYKLGIVEEDNIIYSEPLRFLGKLINLEERDRPLIDQDLSNYLPYSRAAFGFNILQLKNSNTKHYSSIFTLKEYSELSLKKIDEFLQLPQEFIITQTLDFINKDKALAGFQQQLKILDVSEDHRFAEYSGIKDIVDANKDSPTDYGEHNISITLIADSRKQLEKESVTAASTLASFGIIAVKEDLLLEDCFWAQLPGNFNFMRRKAPINTNRIGGFASLSNFPAGKLKESFWGPAVTVLNTINKTPYFFNFHHNDNGHTIIIGPHGAGKSVLLNFLISEATKFNGKIFYFDFFNSSEIFINAIGGTYNPLTITSDTNCFNFNPLDLEDTAENRQHLTEFLGYLLIQKDEIDSKRNYVITPDKKVLLSTIANEIFTLPKTERKLSSLSKFFVNHPNYQKLFALWNDKGKLSKFFSGDFDSFNCSKQIYGFDFTELSTIKTIMVPVLAHLLHKIEISLDGSPTIIVLDEAWRLIDNPFFAPKITNWLDRLKAKNAIVIFASESIDDVKNSKITKLLTEHISTQIYLPNEKAGNYYKDVFGLNDKEFKLLKKLSTDNHNFLLKHGQDSIVAELSLDSMEDLTSVLSANEETLKIMHKVIKKVGNDPEEWVPIFIDVVKDLLLDEDGDEEEEDQEDVTVDLEEYQNNAEKGNDESDDTVED